MSIPNRLNKILEEAIKKGTSDIHLAVGHPPILRVHRELFNMEKEEEITPSAMESYASALLGRRLREIFDKEKQVDFGYNFGKSVRFRVNIYKERGNIAAALRLVPQRIKTLEELNLPPVLHKFTDYSRGLVLITGASSHGKSTTLASLVDEVNHQKKVHIITIEDPIEYIFKDDKALVSQREIGGDAVNFSGALKAALREDPDVIMIGEMRDLETISTAITAAETGHLVFATLHTNSASQTMHRIIDVFPPHQQNQVKAQLSVSLLGVISQRLIITNETNLVPACEIMFANSAIKNLIRENKIHEIPSVIETSGEKGMLPLNSSLSDLVNRGIVSKEAALRYSFNPEDLKQRLL